MASFFLIVGPSGSGKTVLCREINRISKSKHVDLDEIVNVHHNPNYVQDGIQEVVRIKGTKDSLLYLIDLGAGFQNQSDFQKFIHYHQDKVICLYCEPKEAYRRKKKRDNQEWRSFEEYKATEFAPERMRIYNLGRKIKIDGELEKAIDRFIQAIS